MFYSKDMSMMSNDVVHGRSMLSGSLPRQVNQTPGYLMVINMMSSSFTDYNNNYTKTYKGVDKGLFSLSFFDFGHKIL